MLLQNTCSLCNEPLKYYAISRKKEYLICKNCGGVQMDPKYYISKEKEKARYELHNNDIFDLQYQAFVSPITNYIANNFKAEMLGLDFGAGTGPVITELLKKKNYSIQLYDPLFWNDREVLNRKYDYIFACEVIEHFHNPKKEFDLLFSLLKPKGQLIIMTYLYNDSIDFSNWFYKNDETHVFFYTKKTLDYLKSFYNYQDLILDNRLIVFKK